MHILEQAKAAKAASYWLMTLDTSTKNKALHAMADGLLAARDGILSANAEDVRQARETGHAQAFLDRLSLSEQRIETMAEGLRKVAALPDPVGGADTVVRRPNGLSIEKRRVPLGVVGIIYEARPNVTSDAIGLCLKSGNACMLRGGSEAVRSNTAIADCLAEAAYGCGVPEGAIQFVSDTDRETASKMMRLVGYLDVLIPRGGAGLIRSVAENSKVPVIETGVGVCHAFVDASADIAMAADIVFNGKCTRPSVCNALETLLVHADIAARALPAVRRLLDQKHTELRCCERARAILPDTAVASEEDWSTEYGDYILSVRVVDGLDEAIGHINRYGTHHSEVIVTNDYQNAERFLNEVDAAAVYVNASTRFTDGEEFGLGAEIGISTQKIHARGPMGLSELTSVKYVVRGSGQIR